MSLPRFGHSRHLRPHIYSSCRGQNHLSHSNWVPFVASLPSFSRLQAETMHMNIEPNLTKRLPTAKAAGTAVNSQCCKQGAALPTLESFQLSLRQRGVSVDALSKCMTWVARATEIQNVAGAVSRCKGMAWQFCFVLCGVF